MQQKGFQVEHCRPNCPKSTRDWQQLQEVLTNELTTLNLCQALEDKFQPVLQHHIPKVCLAGCPNGCSQPKIKDFGIIGYAIPQITDVPCTGCNACVRSCLEMAITQQGNGITIDQTRCLSCGDCQQVCSSGTLTTGERGWTLHCGGRVGRHPKFAMLAGQITTDQEVVAWISKAIRLYLEQARPHERLTHFLERHMQTLV